MTYVTRLHIYDDPGIRTLRKLANGIIYPLEYLPMMADILAENDEVTSDLHSYILSALQRLPDTDRHKVLSTVSRRKVDHEGTLPELSFDRKLAIVALIGELLLHRGLDSTLDNQWHVLSSAWVDALAQHCLVERAA